MISKETFWSKVATTSKNKCWLWKGALSTGKRGGYGHYTLNYKQIKAHRTAYELHNNVKLNSTDKILHSCDNTLCCNPYHLSKGTSKQNMLDMVKRNRSTSTLTIEDVKQIKSLLGVIKRSELAQQFNVNQSTISRIATGKRWGGVL